MTVGYIGLGKMGRNMALRLQEKGHKVVAFDVSEDARRSIAKSGINTAASIEELVSLLKPPRLVWMMVPQGSVDMVLREVLRYVKRNDTVIDGGNSFYEDTLRRSHMVLGHEGVRFMDAGVSGGPGGARSGACVMVGGRERDFKKFEKLFRDISAGKGYYAYMGSHGAGHFVKMVHNGIEYGMMQAIAEGFELMKKGPYRLDLQRIVSLYNHGSVVESRLIGWLEGAFKEFGPDLKKISGSVGATGEGEWTVKTAKTLGVPVAIIKGAFDFRVRSKKNPSYAGKVLSGMRNQFGGHSIK